MMGIHYTPSVIFGVPEPPGWKKTKRTKEYPVSLRVCPNGHYEGMDSSWRVCPECGARPVKQDATPRTETLSPFEVYLPQDTPEDADPWDHGHQCGLIHTSYGDEDVHLGVTLWSEQDLFFGAAKIPMPTAEQVVALDKYLKYLGYEGHPPKLYIIMHAG